MKLVDIIVGKLRGKGTMCLESISDRFDDPTTLVMCGWKNFQGTSTEPLFDMQTFAGKKAVPLDTWIKAEGGKIGDWGKKYQAGFHIWADETELSRDRRSRRVYYRGVETVGKQNGRTLVVAREMYVPSDPDGWPPLRK